jgi:hypothetical protein
MPHLWLEAHRDLQHRGGLPRVASRPAARAPHRPQMRHISGLGLWHAGWIRTRRGLPRWRPSANP